MKTQDTSKKEKEETRVTPVLIKMGQVFYLSDAKERNVDDYTPSEFDTLALSFVEEITGVNRAVWDVFARAKFLNWLVGERDMELRVRENGSIMLIQSEIKISDLEVHSSSEQAQEAVAIEKGVA